MSDKTSSASSDDATIEQAIESMFPRNASPVSPMTAIPAFIPPASNKSDYIACIEDRLRGVMKGCAGVLNDISTIERFLFGKGGVRPSSLPIPMAMRGLPAIEERLMLAIEQLQAASDRHREILVKLGFQHGDPDPRAGRLPSPPPPKV